MNRPRIVREATPKEILEACGGWYTCPKDAKGRRLGPLVGYAGTYKDGDQNRHYVGDDFADYAMIEQWPDIAQGRVVFPLARLIRDRFGERVPTAYCGAPEGGKSIAELLALAFNSRYIYPEKIELKTDVPGERAPTRLSFGRHRPHPRDTVMIVEDVCNNFSTTLQLIQEIESTGATVSAVVCFLNRSVQWQETFETEGRSWPIIALWEQAMPQWKQDDPSVADDVKAGNLIAKPKPRIHDLREIMRAHAA